LRVVDRAVRQGVILAMGWAPIWLFASPSVHDLEAQYRFSCAPCHGLDGTSRSPAGEKLPGRVLADRKWLAKQNDADLLHGILEGKGAMPSFKYKLTQEEAKRMLSEIIRPLARRAR
jgi:mono/diheme cytochrome c family protein